MNFNCLKQGKACSTNMSTLKESKENVKKAVGGLRSKANSSWEREREFEPSFDHRSTTFTKVMTTLLSN